jgi:hypothetical protein
VHGYLHSYGPATAAHVGRWLGVPATWAARTIAALGDRVRPVALAGETAWLPADAAAAGDGDAPPRGVRLLPYFDAYGVGSHPRALVFPGRAAERALNRGQAGNFPVLLVDGVVAGVWHLRRSGRRLDVTVEALGGVDRALRAGVEEQADRLARFRGGTLRLAFGPVAVGGHA